MSKKKTLREKMRADKKRQESLTTQSSSQILQPSTYTFQQSTSVGQKEPLSLRNTSLKQDLTKTFFLTLGVIVAELILLVVLQKQFVVLPLVRY